MALFQLPAEQGARDCEGNRREVGDILLPRHQRAVAMDQDSKPEVLAEGRSRGSVRQATVNLLPRPRPRLDRRLFCHKLIAVLALERLTSASLLYTRTRRTPFWPRLMMDHAGGVSCAMVSLDCSSIR